MVLYRSAAAAQALHTRCKSLSVQDRQILILANGRHSIDSLLRMMGEAARPAIVQLQQRGFLHSMDAPAPVVQTAAMPTLGQGNTGHSSASSSKRSRAAAKMYMLDMLGMIRSSDSASLRVQLQTAQDDHDLALALRDALLFMRSQSSGAYADKAAQQLQAITPLEILQQLDAQCSLVPC